jgi:acid phosphatase
MSFIVSPIYRALVSLITDIAADLSGDSPYFNSPGVGLTAAVPTGCSVTRATYLIRHSDIFANDFEFENTLSPFLQKLGNFTDRSVFNNDSSLAFLSNWTSPYTDPEEQIEKVTDLGKVDAGALGALIAQRHKDILGGSSQFKVWTADASRDQDTAHAFIEGFNMTFSNISLVVVDEGEEQAANTLTPHVCIVTTKRWMSNAE